MRSIGTCILLGLSTVASAQTQIFSRLDSFSYSEPVTLKAATEELAGDFRAGEHAFTHDQFELGVRRGGWSLAWLARYDYHLRFHPDTAELMHRKENDLPIELGRRYRLDLEVNHLKATGLKLAYHFQPSPRFRGSAALSYLKTEELLEGRAQGHFTPFADRSIDAEAQYDYVYYEDKLLDRPVAGVTGEGVALDLRLAWQAGESLSVGLDAEDLYSEIRWDEAPFTTARLSSNVVSLTPEGLIETQPVLSGTEGFRNHRQHLPVRATGWADWHWSEGLRSGVELFAVDSLLFPRLTHQQALSAYSYWRMLWDFKAEALGLAYARQYVQVSLISDRVDLSEAHTLGVALAVTIPL